MTRQQPSLSDQNNWSTTAQNPKFILTFIAPSTQYTKLIFTTIVPPPLTHNLVYSLSMDIHVQVWSSVLYACLMVLGDLG